MRKLPKSAITRDLVLEYLDYDPLTGIFTWRKPPRKGVGIGRAGTIASRRSCRAISLKNSQPIKEHHLVWLIVHGRWPHANLVIDHINGDPLDNRLSNLREVNIQTNSLNTTKTRANRASICFDKSRGLWMSYLDRNRKRTYLGRFSSKEEAEAAFFTALDRYNRGY